MFSFSLHTLCAILTYGVVSSAPPTQNSPSIQVIGDVTKPLTLTNGEMASQFSKEVKTVRYTLKKEKARARAVPLYLLVQTAQPTLDPKRKNAPLSFAVVVTGNDGYTVTFGMGELSLANEKNRVLIALDKNDKPFSEKDSPAMLIVPGDLKPSRWIHQIKTIRLIDLAKPGQ